MSSIFFQKIVKHNQLCKANLNIMKRRYLTYILLFGFPLFGCQNTLVEKSAYQQKWTLLKQENEALAFDADLQLSDAEIALDKKLFQLRKKLPYRDRQKENTFV